MVFDRFLFAEEQTASAKWRLLIGTSTIFLLLGNLNSYTSGNGLTTTLFEPGVAIPGGTGGAISTAAADLNLDGIPEIVTIATRNSIDPHFRILSRSNVGVWQTFDVLPSSEIASNRFNRFGGDSIIVDLNGDNYPDILVPESPNGPGAGQLSWFENPGNSELTGQWTENIVGTWDGSSGADRPAHMSEVHAGDLDGDADIDLVTRDVNNGLHILIGDGLGNFDRHFLPVNPREGLDLFDPDQDGDLDILINGVWLEAPDQGTAATQFADLPDTQNYVHHSLGVQPATGLSWYPDENDFSTQSNYASKVLAADLNGDGRKDVVITNSEELNNNSVDDKPEGLTIYFADDDSGTAWTPLDVLTEGRQFHTLEAADLDLDGDLDLITGVSNVGQGNDAAEVFALINEGLGANWSKLPIDEVNIYSGIVVDFDNDGDGDVVGPDDWRSGELRYFESHASKLSLAASGDYNRDGTTDDLDLEILKESYGTTVSIGFLGADGNGNSRIDGGDFLLWQSQVATQSDTPQPSQIIPEPTTTAMLLITSAWLTTRLPRPAKR